MSQGVKTANVPTEETDIGHPTAESQPIVNAELKPTNEKGIQEIPHPGIQTA